MAGNFRNPLFEAEPFEESQGRQAVASPDELHKFYSDMERRELAQRRLSRTKTISRPRWRGKSVKSAAGDMQSLDGGHSSSETTLLRSEKQQEFKTDESHTPPMLLEDELRGSLTEQLDLSQLSTSIIPDAKPPPGLPSPFSSSPQSTYTINNPVGPRWYTNHHLIPPHVRIPLPPSFSPSFPPMPRAEDAGRIPSPSRTPSGSPLPTPTSSQTRLVTEGAPGVRTRKISQTAHDGVDLMDGTDPWGTNWHHGSPYDIGLNQGQGQVSQTASDVGQAHSKNKITSSNSLQFHRKTGTPSPLSQSTSAVHLQDEKTPTTVVRTQSKRKAGIRRTLFGGSDRVESAPLLKTTIPDISNNRMSVPNESVLVKRKPSKRAPQLPHSISSGSASKYPVAELSSLPSYVADHKGKRGSMFNRLTRRFSILRRSTMDSDAPEGKNQLDVEGAKISPLTEVKGALQVSDQFFDESNRKNVNSTKRVPPPALDDAKITPAVESNVDIGKRSLESVSVEAPFKIGKLKITNPDVESGVTASARSSVASPLNNVDNVQQQSSEAQIGGSLEGKLAANEENIRYESPVNHLVALSISPTESHPPLVPEKDDKYDPVNSSPLPDIPIESPVLVEEARVVTPSVSKIFSVMQNNSNGTSANHSPVSKASILANPPTPHLLPLNISPSMDVLAQTPLSSEQGEHRSSNEEQSKEIQVKSGDDTQHSKSARKEKGKQPFTETFKLVRSSSDHVRNSQMITVGDEQWELVEAPDTVSRKHRSSKDKARSKSKDAELFSKKESSKRERTQSDVRVDQEKARERNTHKSHHDRTSQKDNIKPVDRQARAHSLDPPSRRASYLGTKSAVVTQKVKGQDKSHANKNGQTSAESTILTPTTLSNAIDNKGLSSNSNYARIPRRSLTQRPVSDTPTFAEWTALSAKEAWEADRLWKGKSVFYGPEVIGVVSSPNVSSHPEKPFDILNGQIAMKSSDAVYDLGHGSSHTAYMVQRPFQGQGGHANSFYSQLRVPQAPSLYQLPLANAPTYASPGFYDYPKSYPSFPETATQPLNTSRPPLSNPLPEPPRMSSYKPPTIIPASANTNANDKDPSTAEYWNKYAGIATTH